MSPQTSPATVDRVRKVLRLLGASRDIKLLASGSGEAIRRLREAEEIAQAPPRVSGSLAALVQYRLGHLYLRQARSQKDVEEAEQCFRDATRNPMVAPWAFPYLLACLHRLRQFPGASEGLKRNIGATWTDAIRRVSAAPERDVDEGEPIPLQAATFNLLELATFFLNLPHDQLLGAAGGSGDHTAPSGGLLVGAGLEHRRDALPFAIAEELVMGIGKHTEGAIVFTLPPGKAKPQIWSASEDRDELGPESVLGPAIARLLAFVLLGEAASSDALNHALAGHDASEQGRGEYDDRRRKILERARRKLAAVARRPPDKVIVDNGDGGLRLGEGIALYGAVDLRRLDDGEP